MGELALLRPRTIAGTQVQALKAAPACAGLKYLRLRISHTKATKLDHGIYMGYLKIVPSRVTAMRRQEQPQVQGLSAREASSNLQC